MAGMSSAVVSGRTSTTGFPCLASAMAASVVSAMWPWPVPGLAGSPVANGPMDAHLKLVLNGKPGTAMAAFGPQLSDSDIAAVLTYQRNAFGNTPGDLIQPKAVQAAR